MPNCWSCVTRTPCCVARSPGCTTRLPTGRGWPPYPGLYRVAAGRRSSRWLLPPSWPGIARWSRADGTTPHAASPDVLRPPQQLRTWSFAWRRKTPPGGTGECRANWSGLAIASPPPPCGKSCTTPGSIPHRVGRGRIGVSSSPRRPRPSWRWTSCIMLSTFAVMRRRGPRLAGRRGFLGLWLVGVMPGEIGRR
jgi:hypothetical protein